MLNVRTFLKSVNYGPLNCRKTGFYLRKSVTTAENKAKSPRLAEMSQGDPPKEPFGPSGLLFSIYSAPTRLGFSLFCHSHMLSVGIQNTGALLLDSRLKHSGMTGQIQALPSCGNSLVQHLYLDNRD